MQICSQNIHTRDLGQIAFITNFLVFSILSQAQTNITSAPDLMYEFCAIIQLLFKPKVVFCFFFEAILCFTHQYVSSLTLLFELKMDILFT